MNSDKARPHIFPKHADIVQNIFGSSFLGLFSEATAHCLNSIYHRKYLKCKGVFHCVKHILLVRVSYGQAKMVRNKKSYVKDEDQLWGVNNLVYYTVIIRETETRNNERITSWGVVLENMKNGFILNHSILL